MRQFKDGDRVVIKLGDIDEQKYYRENIKFKDTIKEKWQRDRTVLVIRTLGYNTKLVGFTGPGWLMFKEDLELVESASPKPVSKPKIKPFKFPSKLTRYDKLFIKFAQICVENSSKKTVEEIYKDLKTNERRIKTTLAGLVDSWRLQQDKIIITYRKIEALDHATNQLWDLGKVKMSLHKDNKHGQRSCGYHRYECLGVRFLAPYRNWKHYHLYAGYCNWCPGDFKYPTHFYAHGDLDGFIKEYANYLANMNSSDSWNGIETLNEKYLLEG